MINREDLLSGTRPELGQRILVTDQSGFQGYEIMDYKGMVWGISMRSKDALQDAFMGFRRFVGGELTSYTELSDESRQKALDRLLASARRIGANAVINFRFEISKAIYGGDAEVIAYGNAVKIRPIKNYVPTGGLGNILAEFVDAYLQDKGIETKQEDNTIKEGRLEESENGTSLYCPHCNLKYRVTKDEYGKTVIKGFSDVDSKEAGIQIFCMKCGKKFTIPNS